MGYGVGLGRPVLKFPVVHAGAAGCDRQRHNDHQTPGGMLGWEWQQLCHSLAMGQGRAAFGDSNHMQVAGECIFFWTWWWQYTVAAAVERTVYPWSV